jgi:hypothetical protein
MSVSVMAGLVPAIHADGHQCGFLFALNPTATSDEPKFGGAAWMPGTSPGMTELTFVAISIKVLQHRPILLQRSPRRTKHVNVDIGLEWHSVRIIEVARNFYVSK